MSETPNINPDEISRTRLNSPPLKRFLALLVLFMLPFVLFVAAYGFLDPFRIIWPYTDYNGSVVALNRDFVSSETYINRRTEFHYDSFIFGSSRTTAFRISEWRPYLEPDASPFKFDASSEGLYGIWQKIKFIDRQGDRLRNAIILVCADCTLQRTTNMSGYLFIKHPAVVGYGWKDLHLASLRAWCSDWFFLRYIDFKIFGVMRPYMSGFIETRGIRFDPVTNDMFADKPDAELAADEDGYYESREHLFYDRSSNPGEAPARIGDAQRRMLEEIQHIFAKHGTRYRIVVSPLYDQVAINRQDLDQLRELFGTETVFDFSGVNAITAEKRNYYETSHFRPHIGRRILAEIYSSEKNGP